MQYEITSERLNYLSSNGKIVLNACPGSGKTTSIVKKIGSLIQNWEDNHGNYSGIACLSFTNAAKDELLNKYYEVNGEYLRYPHLVSTIDSFTNRFITLPFFNLLSKDFPRPKIVDNDMIVSNALRVTYKGKDGKYHDGIEYPLNLFKDKANRPLFRSYNVQDIWLEKNGRFTHKGKNPSSIIVDDETFQKYGTAIFHKKISKGLITSLDSSFIALHLLSEYKRIGECLIKRFPYFIIDEAQDNSELQHAIFDKLIELGLENIELVGDPYQSLYEWRHAKPQLFYQKYISSDWQGLPLSENRRSNQRIIDCFSCLRLNSDHKILSKDVVDLNLPILIYKYNETNKDQIINDFDKRCKNNKLTKNQIVVRGNTLKNRMLGNSIPLEPWINDTPYILIQAMHSMNVQDIKGSIKELRKLSINLMHPDADHKKSRDLQDQYSEDNNHNALLFDLLRSIPPLSLSFEDWTIECQNILIEFFKLKVVPIFEFKKRMTGYKMKDLLKESIEIHINQNSTTLCKIPITTIHKVKGRTLDSLLYFFNENSTGQNVSFNDFVESVAFPTEKQRMIYVACSRPKQLLALAFPQKILDRLISSRFGPNIEIVSKV
jgi:DNA helicase-2/ATP-dependent DNA helicase PcrA